LPPIGFGMASHGNPLSPREVALLSALRPAHLRVDLQLSSPGYAAALERAVTSARQLGCGLELALFVTDNAESELAGLAQRLEGVQVPIRRLLVFHAGEQATSERWIALARERLAGVGGNALVAGGTNANFCELNRYRPQPASGDGLTYAITPQIHAFDERSIAENLAGQAETVLTARAFTAEAPVIVSPVTLKKRFNSVATTAEPALQAGELPAQVDPRQMSLFTAGWTVGSVKSLTEAGASSLTYFETSGWRGVIETDTGSPEPELFPSRPGEVFPVYHVFADLAEWQSGQLLNSRSDDPLAVEVLAMRGEGRTRVLLANLTPSNQRAQLGPLPDGEVRIRCLDASSAPLARGDPQTFRATGEAATVSSGELDLRLPPFSVVRIDGASS
jgi:D-apionolactonase